MNKPYRLGLDVGTNSLGWAILDLDQHNQVCRVRKIGSRIFSDGDFSPALVPRHECDDGHVKRHLNDLALAHEQTYVVG